MGRRGPGEERGPGEKIYSKEKRRVKWWREEERWLCRGGDGADIFSLVP